MWRLLPALLLVSCALQEPDDRVGETPGPDGPRIVGVLDLPMAPVTPAGAGQPAAKAFQGRDVRGEVRASGGWGIRAAVTHTRMRCATYETGIQLGRGNEDCSNVRWLTEVQLGTRQTHCNGATRIHAGGGELPLAEDTFEQSNCVRVLTRCAGPC